MKKTILPFVLLIALLAAGCQHKETPYNRTSQTNEYERVFRNKVFAACQNPDKFYATYALAHMDKKPTNCDPRYKVTFLNGPCQGKTVYTKDVIEKTAPVGGSQLLKGQVLLRDYWNPRKLNADVAELNRWNRGVVKDTSRLEKEGVVELEFPRDSNDFMAPREFIFVQNLRFIQKPEQKDPRIWL